jgi:hypothetical protein
MGKETSCIWIIPKEKDSRDKIYILSVAVEGQFKIVMVPLYFAPRAENEVLPARDRVSSSRQSRDAIFPPHYTVK